MRAYLIFAMTALLLFTDAGAITVSGNVLLLPAPPAAAGPGDLVSRTHASAWIESQDIAVLSPLAIDVIPFQNNVSGNYKSRKKRIQSAWSGILAPDRYDSFMLHADQTGRKAEFSGSMTFDTDIVGIIFKQGTLGATDSLLGSVFTRYADPGDRREFGLRGKKNWFSISSDLRTFKFQTVVGRTLEELRILTRSPATTMVPIPASAWLFGSSVLVLGGIRRRFRRQPASGR